MIDDDPGTNAIVIKIFVGYSALISRDVAFCDNMYGYIENLLKKSTLIGAVIERGRNYFFKSIRRKNQSRKQNLKYKPLAIIKKNFWPKI